MPSPIRIAVLGLGAVAQSVHLPLLRRRPDLFDVVAVADLSPSLTERVATMFGLPEAACRRPDDLLDTPGLDAVLIAAGGAHAAAVVAAAERGLAIMCEKPLGVSHAELDTVAAAVGTARVSLMVGYMKQYDPAVDRLAELLADVDDIRAIDVTVLHPTGASQLDFAHLLHPAGDIPPDELARISAETAGLREQTIGEADDTLWSSYAGCIMSSLSHDFSVIRQVRGPITEIDFADIWRRRSSRQVRETGRDAGLGEVPPSIRAVGRLADGTRCLLDWHYLHDFPAYRETVRVVHGAGSVELAFPSPYLLHAPTVVTERTLDGEAERVSEYRSIAESFERQLEAFAALVQGGPQPRTGLEGARDDVVTGQAIIASLAAREGLAVGGEIGRLLGRP